MTNNPKTSTKSVFLSGTLTFAGPKDNIWDIVECPTIPQMPNFLDLSECKKKCLSNKKCTAIMFDNQPSSPFKCVLQKCTLPVPKPTIRNKNYKGYFIEAGIDRDQ